MGWRCNRRSTPAAGCAADRGLRYRDQRAGTIRAAATMNGRRPIHLERLDALPAQSTEGFGPTSRSRKLRADRIRRAHRGPWPSVRSAASVHCSSIYSVRSATPRSFRLAPGSDLPEVVLAASTLQAFLRGLRHGVARNARHDAGIGRATGLREASARLETDLFVFEFGLASQKVADPTRVGRDIRQEPKGGGELVPRGRFDGSRYAHRARPARAACSVIYNKSPTTSRTSTDSAAGSSRPRFRCRADQLRKILRFRKTSMTRSDTDP